ncbi:MAG: hypothetical protein LBB88_05570 [Planctomycetaceae bacterium]|nr:hypothetical protein [Planctomycetaceae bacterium]
MGGHWGQRGRWGHWGRTCLKSVINDSRGLVAPDQIGNRKFATFSIQKKYTLFFCPFFFSPLLLSCFRQCSCYTF